MDSPVENVTQARALLDRHAGVIVAQSALYRTPCYPVGAGPDFINAVVAIDTSCGVDELLRVLHTIEAAFDRERGQRWAARTLDLDLIAYDDLIRPDESTLRHWMSLPLADQLTQTPTTLILPHPRMQERGFVLVPLAEIAPHWRHPLLGLTARELCAALDPADLAQITLLNGEM